MWRVSWTEKHFGKKVKKHKDLDTREEAEALKGALDYEAGSSGMFGKVTITKADDLMGFK